MNDSQKRPDWADSVIVANSHDLQFAGSASPNTARCERPASRLPNRKSRVLKEFKGRSVDNTNVECAVRGCVAKNVFNGDALGVYQACRARGCDYDWVGIARAGDRSA